MNEPQTTANPKITDPITWNSLVKTYDKFAKEFGNIPTGIRCSPQYYLKLKNFFDQQELEDMLKGVKKAPVTSLNALTGMEVMIDVDMEPGTWKFIYKNLDTK